MHFFVTENIQCWTELQQSIGNVSKINHPIIGGPHIASDQTSARQTLASVSIAPLRAELDLSSLVNP